eukprot:TRINITY_DN7588_c0_g1_i1.p1 TRINITY_DN7588_c0_g1~~TRINITY_DN7588_c0_g1_i1.p1  ORF type:complete len:239 (+),score=88.32 TRINITY_DN7588_c0_g1_i1:85-717(+)
MDSEKIAQSVLEDQKEKIEAAIRGVLSDLKDPDSVDYIVELIMEPGTLTEDEVYSAVEDLLRNYTKLTEVRIVGIVEELRSRAENAKANDEVVDDLFLELELEKTERLGICRLCNSDARITIHHLIPKLVLKRMRNHNKSRVDVARYLVEVCRPCHNELHRLWGHGELAREYQTVESILQAEEIKPYLNWKRKKERTTDNFADDDDDADA